MHLFVVLVYMAINIEYEKLFSHLEPMAPPEDLFGNIKLRIRHEERIMAIRKTAVLSMVAILSIGAFVPFLNSTAVAVARSGLLQFVLLLFSDSEVVISIWQDYVLTILESLPITEIAVLLGTTLFLVYLIKNIAQNIVIVFEPFSSLNHKH